MPILYDNSDSGNCYKARLMLALLGRSFGRVEIDTGAGETHTDEFLAINPAGRVPVLVLDDGRAVIESNAILFYLAEGTDFWPDDRFARADVLRWLFFEQYSHEPFIAVLRHWHRHLAFTPEMTIREPAMRENGEAALQVMEDHLKTREWFVGGRATIADLALYAYTHCAEDGPFSLASRPGIRRWLLRVRELPGYVPMRAA